MRVPHNPPHSYGDCFRACIASILEMDVPHFLDGNEDDDWPETTRSLSEDSFRETKPATQ